MSAIYETDKTLSEYLLFHYGAAEEVLPLAGFAPQGMQDALDFAVRTPRHFSAAQRPRGLDLGCAVGRSTFEMSRTCDETIGIDFSHSFIAAAEELRQGREIPYQRREEGALTTPLIAKVALAVDTKKIRFLQGDAMNLAADLGTFDRVHAANLLCRLAEPLKLIDRLLELVNAGGELVIATPCTWLEEFTPPENWPKTTTLEWLMQKLSKSFTLVRTTSEAFLIRETARKFQWSSSLVTVWQRNP
jgi:putative 4-mercaptohistidine N1-methyltranferase